MIRAGDAVINAQALVDDARHHVRATPYSCLYCLLLHLQHFMHHATHTRREETHQQPFARGQTARFRRVAGI